MWPFWSASGGCIQFLLVPVNRIHRFRGTFSLSSRSRAVANSTHHSCSFDFCYSSSSAPTSAALSFSYRRSVTVTCSPTPGTAKSFHEIAPRSSLATAISSLPIFQKPCYFLRNRFPSSSARLYLPRHAMEQHSRLQRLRGSRMRSRDAK